MARWAPARRLGARMNAAVVIGAGPNGLVAANVLADHGWSVTVLEAQAAPGGGVRSSEFVEPGFVNDHCSVFYPLSAVSPAIRSLSLEDHGLHWRHAPLVLAHPTLDDDSVVLSRDGDETAHSLDTCAPGDGDVWRALVDRWVRYEPSLVDALLTPFPPIRASIGLARKGGSLGELLELARLGVLPVRRLGQERFRGARAARLLAGLALHADLFPESTLGGFFGWLLACLGQRVGFPVPRRWRGRDHLGARGSARGARRKRPVQRACGRHRRPQGCSCGRRARGRHDRRRTASGHRRHRRSGALHAARSRRRSSIRNSSTRSVASRGTTRP